MAFFDKPTPGVSTPLGRQQYLRSSVGNKFESYTISAAAQPTETIKNAVGADEELKYLQSGEAAAKITSGPEAGKIGVYQVGATDGRADTANLVGINNSYLPAALNDGDEQVGVLYVGTAVQGWCTIRDATGKRIPMTDAVADALRSKKGLDITFK
ncbi:LamD-like capsid decoration protein [Gordonia phage Camerico]|nr:LamD-like capsid decoration protein [Gordonia phage Camerico]